MHVALFSSAFCGSCRAARRVLAQAQAMVPQLEWTDIDVAAAPERAAEADVASTPTFVVTRDDGTPVFRAAGAPRLDQLLAALAMAMSEDAGA